MRTNRILIILFLVITNVFSNKIQAINKAENLKIGGTNFILEISESVTDTSSEYSNKTNDELKVLLKNAISNEDYETAEKIKNIIDARPKQVAKKPKVAVAPEKNIEVTSKPISHIEKGKLIIGGTFGLSTSSKKNESEFNTIRSKDDIYSQFNFNLTPQVGIMLSNKFAIGLGMGINYEKTTTYDNITSGILSWDNEEREGVFSFLPFARYYLQAGTNAYFFGEFEMGIGVGSYKYKTLNSTGTSIEDGDPIKIFNFTTKLSVGFNYFINKKWALEAKWGALSFSSSTYKQEGVLTTTTYYNKNTYKDFGFGFDFTSISFGLRVFL